jgi:hypothetical protein
MSLAVVQLGELGDLLVLLPALQWLSGQGQDVSLVTGRQHADNFRGLPWLAVHALDLRPRDVRHAIRYARLIADEVRVTQLYYVPYRPTQRSYQLELWHRAGVPVDLFDELPLELNRDPAAEADLVNRWLHPNSTRCNSGD